MDEFDRRLLNRLQQGLPLVRDPWGELATELDCSAERIRQRLQELLDDGTLTRFGPMFDIEQLGGAFYLFLRGMPEAGVYFARPSDALLDALDQLFEGSH